MKLIIFFFNDRLKLILTLRVDVKFSALKKGTCYEKIITNTIDLIMIYIFLLFLATSIKMQYFTLYGLFNFCLIEFPSLNDVFGVSYSPKCGHLLWTVCLKNA